MIESMTAGQRRALAVGVLVAGIVTILGVTVLPFWLANAAAQARIDELTDRLARAERVAAQDTELRSRYQAMRRAQSSRGYLLASETDAVAAAELQRILKDIATANGTNLMSTQILPAAESGELTRIALRVRLNGSLPGIVRTIYDLETNGIFLFLDNVSLRRATGRRLRATVTLDYFEANFDLIGYMAEGA